MIQCLLKSKNAQIVTYLPEKFAKVGILVRLKFNDKWSDGWVVMEVYNKLTEKQLIDLRAARQLFDRKL